MGQAGVPGESEDHVARAEQKKGKVLRGAYEHDGLDGVDLQPQQAASSYSERDERPGITSSRSCINCVSLRSITLPVPGKDGRDDSHGPAKCLNQDCGGTSDEER